MKTKSRGQSRKVARKSTKPARQATKKVNEPPVPPPRPRIELPPELVNKLRAVSEKEDTLPNLPQKWSPMKVTRTFRSEVERLVFVGDIHVPFHDRLAVSLMLQFVAHFKPHRIYLIGDIFDFYQLSSFDKDPLRMLTLQDELDQCYGVLSAIRAAAPDADIIYREGNHEHRLTKMLWRIPELSPLRSLQLPELLGFKELQIRHVSYYEELRYGDFLVEHGNMVRPHSAYTASAHLQKRGLSGISGHTHRLGACYRTDYSGPLVWYENGCLCQTKVHYAIGLPNWQQGFSCSFQTGSRFIVEQLPIIDGKLFAHGNMWQAEAGAAA